MKEFFRRHEVRVEVGDLRRFAKVLIDDLGPVLEGYEFVLRLFDTEEQEAGLSEEVKGAVAENSVCIEAVSNKLHLPVVFEGTPLGLITAAPPQGRELPEGSAPFLPTLIRLSLEKILLYKINITDQETALYNEDYFRTYMSRKLEEAARQASEGGRLRPLSLGDQEDHPGLTVLLAEIALFDKLAAEHGRLEAARAVKALSRWLEEAAPQGSCLARLDKARLGLVLPHQNIRVAQDLADQVSHRSDQGDEKYLPRMRLAFGLANFPLDFVEAPGQGSSSDSDRDNLAELMMSKAELALDQALSDKGAPVFSFRDVLQRGGRVLQVLPYDRVVVNLGRMVGARVGQVFILSEAGKPEEVDYKGQVVLFDVRENFALGEVINLRSSISRVQPEDRLTLSQAGRGETSVGERSPEESLDPLLGVPDHQGFIRQMAEGMDGLDRFAVILIRVDEFDRYRKTMGHLESDRHLKGLYDLLLEDMPQEAPVGRFSTESLAVFCRGFEETEARTLAETWRDKISSRLRQTASFGLAVYPCGPYAPEDTLTNAQKALEHASFLGPASVAAFDSISLNISGDKLFEAGDLDGAILEYNQALKLNPDDLNVLNSLGVCYGYQKRPDLGLETFDRVLEKDPGNLMALYNRGFAYAMDGRPEEALESFRRAAEIEGEDFDVLFQIGKTALDLDLLNEALSSLTRASELESARPIVFRYLGQALVRAGSPEEAEDAFKAAVRHDPEDAPSLSQLGVLFMDRGSDLEVALSLTRQSVELDQTNGLFRQRLARALALIGDLEAAESEYKRALEMGTRTREALFELGRIV